MKHIKVKSRDIGYGVEEYEGDAYVTDEVDSWGKRTVLVSNGDAFNACYLFPDEWVETAK